MCKDFAETAKFVPVDFVCVFDHDRFLKKYYKSNFLVNHICLQLIQTFSLKVVYVEGKLTYYYAFKFK